MSIPNGRTPSGRILSIPVTLEASVLKYGGSVRGVECQFSSLRCRSGGGGAGQRSSCGTTRPGHVQCLLDTKQLPKWSSHSEAVEYPMLLLLAA